MTADLDPSLKDEAERLLRGAGLSPAGAIELLYREVVRVGGLPFSTETRGADCTRQVLADSKRGVDVQAFESAEELFEDLSLVRQAGAF